MGFMSKRMTYTDLSLSDTNYGEYGQWFDAQKSQGLEIQIRDYCKVQAATPSGYLAVEVEFKASFFCYYYIEWETILTTI